MINDDLNKTLKKKKTNNKMTIDSNDSNIVEIILGKYRRLIISYTAYDDYGVKYTTEKIDVLDITYDSIFKTFTVETEDLIFTNIKDNRKTISLKQLHDEFHNL